MNIKINKKYKKINEMALPLILNNVTSMIIGLCDQAMIGRVSLSAFAAVGIITSTVNSIAGVLGMTSIAFNIIGAKCKGQEDYDGLYNNFIFNILLSCIIGTIFFLLALCFGNIVLIRIYKLENETLNDAAVYLKIFSISVGLNMILFTFSSYLKIINKTKYILYGNIFASVSNVLFDYALIFGNFGFPKMGIRGNAIGSIMALLLNMIIYIVVLRKNLSIRCNVIKVIKNWKEMFKISIPLMGQEFLESTILVIVINAILSRIGILEVSTYNLLSAIITIGLMPMYAYSQTALTLISENFGVKKKKELIEIPIKCLVYALIFYSIISLLIIIFKSKIPRIITNDTDLIVNSTKYIPMVVGLNIFNFSGTVHKYCLQAIGDEKWVFISSIIFNIIGIFSIFMLSITLNYKLNGVYLGIMLNYIVLALTFYFRYNKLISNI